MGIKCLLPYLKDVTEGAKLNDFKGKTAAIDGSCWMHKALTASITSTGGFNDYKRIIQGYLEVVVRSGVKPIVVFDGFPLPAKSREQEKRARLKEEAYKRIEILKKSGGKKEDIWRLHGQAVTVENHHVVDFIQECVQKRIPYVVAPFEADTQLAWLAKNGLVDLVITEDSDILAYGCKKVFLKLKMDGSGDFADGEDCHTPGH